MVRLVSLMKMLSPPCGRLQMMSQRACIKGKLTLNHLCSLQVASMQVWGCEVSMMVAQASMDNESQMECPSRFDVLGTDTDKGAKVCTTV